MPPQVITARLRLRPFTLRDVDAYHQAIHADPAVMRFLQGGQPRPRIQTEALIERIIGWWAAHAYGLWAVETMADRKLIGHCGLAREPSTGVVELAYALARPAWGQGFATEAARAALRCGFERANLAEIIALAVPENSGSRHVMEKLGMRFEGISTNYYGGASMALYALSRANFDPGDAPYELVEGRAVRPA